MFSVKRLLILFGTISFLFKASASVACSMDSEWVKPSNFELVEMADAIVIGTALQQLKGTEPYGPSIQFRVDQAIKGSGPVTVATMGRFWRDTPSDQVNLQVAHPSSYAGPCARSDFTKGGRYLLFLERAEDGGWAVVREAFSRTMEDYGGPDSVWTRAVRRYIDIEARYGAMERQEALADLIVVGKDRNGAVLTDTEIKDIKSHLSSLSPYKPTEYLLEAYARLERGQTPEHGVRSRDADRELGPAQALTDAMFGDRLPPSGPDLTSMKRHVLTSLVTGDHASAMPLFRRLQRQPDDAVTLGLKLRFLAKHGAYPEVFSWIANDLFRLLPTLTEADQRALLSAVSRVQTGDDHDHPRWRSDARANAEWPELALKLYSWQAERWGHDRAFTFDDAISLIPVTDYRARPELTLALVRGYDDAAHKWAVREALNAPDAAAATLPLLALLSSWTAEDSAILKRVYCQGGPKRLELIRLLGESADELHGALLLQVDASRLAEHERAAVRKALARWKSRFGEEPRGDYSTDGIRMKPQTVRCT